MALVFLEMNCEIKNEKSWREKKKLNFFVLNFILLNFEKTISNLPWRLGNKREGR